MKGWGQIALLAVGMVLATYVYYLWPLSDDRDWWQHRFRAVEAIILWSVILARYGAAAGRLAWVGVLLCSWGIFQNGEIFVCSFGGRLDPAPWHGLCTAHYGNWPNLIIASLFGATLLLPHLTGRKAHEQSVGGTLRGFSFSIRTAAGTVATLGCRAALRAASAICYHFRSVR